MERQVFEKYDGGQVTAGSPPDTKQDHFHHSQLPGRRYIRLLRIIQGDAESISISITLHTFPLDQLPEYEALSYTWGKAILTSEEEDNDDPGMEYEIFVNSESFIITENLYDGLSELRKDVTGYLWVDALCIDQTNKDERAAQVLLMGNIYSSATRVIIWLGKLIPEVEDVIWLRERYLPIAEEGRFPVEEANADMLSFLGITSTRWFGLWTSYGRVYSTYRWFSRAWIVQELILARDVLIRCGEETIDWEILVQLTFRSIEVGCRVTPESRKFFAFSAYHSVMAEEGGLEKYKNKLSLLTGSKTIEERWYSWLFHLVDMIDLQRAGCLHDKIYAVFGIALKAQPASLRHAKCLGVNYQQPAEDSFCLFTTDILRHLPTLAVLSYVSPSSHDVTRKLKTLPSWCPDYSARRRIVPLLILNSLSSDPAQVFSASKSLVREMGPCLVTGKLLSVSGKRVARVAKDGQATLGMIVGELAFPVPNTEDVFDSCRCLEQVYSLTGQDRVEVLWRTLLVDRSCMLGIDSEAQYPPAERFSPAFGAFIAFSSAMALYSSNEKDRVDLFDKIRAREVDFRSSLVELPSISTIIELAEEMKDDTLEGLLYLENVKLSNIFWGPAQQYNSGRKLFTTSQKWLGLGPECLEQDDEVWLLKHAAVPFILRPHGESQYTLVGEAYVHGIMHGELVDAPGGTEGFMEIQIV
jgi:hypothetical protein